MGEKFGDSFLWRHLQVVGLGPPDCWNGLITKLDNTPFPWNFVWFLEDDIVLPEGGLEAMFERLFAYRQVYPATVGASYQTWVHRFDRGRIPAISWRDESEGLILTCGWYCLLLDRQALQIFQRPIFQERHIMGQDVFMTGALNNAGFRIVAVPGVSLPHLRVDEFKYKGWTNRQWAGPHKRSEY